MRKSFLLFLFLSISIRASASDNWVEVRSPHFIVASNAGEKEARRVANQFEEIRNLFHSVSASLRVDPGKPLIVVAIKNEDSLKGLLPDYYVTKDRTRLAGMYVPRFDRNFAILRTDVSGSAENPYHALYHEYTHSIMRLNFPALPTWLDEGLAEFYGNTLFSGSEVGVGRVSQRQLNALHRSPFIPIATLMNVDQRSPLYNEQDRASIFYAESWVLVHYLMTNPEARKDQVLARYLKVLSDTNDSEEAARQSFGDLKRFGERLESYTRQFSFQYMKLKTQEQFSDKEYAVRSLTSAEALEVQAEFLLHTGHGHEARAMLNDAVQQQPALASAHSALGLYDYQQHDNDAAEKEFEQALQLDANDFRCYYYLAEILYRRTGYRQDSTPLIIKHLEKLEQVNPDFAPAHAFLSVAYRQQKETREKALAEAMNAAKLDPTLMAYVADVGDALIALDRDKDAQYIAATMVRRARTPFEKGVAENFNKRLARHLDWKSKNPGKTPGGTALAVERVSTSEDIDENGRLAPEKASTPESDVPPAERMDEGVIREAHCDGTSATVKFAILGETLLLGASDIQKLEYRSGGAPSTLAANPCSTWNNRKARIAYKPSAEAKFKSDIVSIEFE